MTARHARRRAARGGSITERSCARRRTRGPRARGLLVLLVALLGATGSGRQALAGGDVITVPGDAATIAEAVEFAEAGDEIRVAAGTYLERITIPNRGLTLRAEDGPLATTIDAASGGLAIRIETGGSGDPTVVEGFTVTGGVGVLGGGIYAEGEPVIRSCIVARNVAALGGGICLVGGDARVEDCWIAGNEADLAGAAIYKGSSGSITVDRCTILGNVTAGSDGAAVDLAGGGLELVGSLVYDNVPADVVGDVVVRFSGVGSGLDGLIDGGGNLDPGEDPGFADADGPDDRYGTADDDPRLTGGSPAVNAGDPAASGLPATDLDGAMRLQQCRLDMGAFESPFFRDCNDNGVADACDIADGTSEDLDMDGRPDECPFTVPGQFDTIQAAIDAAPDVGATIEVSPGTYVERITFREKEIVVESTDGPDVTTIEMPRDEEGNVVTIDGGQGGETRLEGFTIRARSGGPRVSAADGQGDGDGKGKGSDLFRGLFVSGNSMPRIVDCTFIDGIVPGNLSSGGDPTGFGGGALVGEATAVFESCRFEDNFALSGGGLATYDGTVELIDCTFTGNEAAVGGGIVAFESTVTMTGGSIESNLAEDGDGGGLFVFGAFVELNGVSVAMNQSEDRGGGIVIDEFGSVLMTGGSIVGNRSTEGGGLHVQFGDVELEGVTIEGNVADQVGGGLMIVSDDDSFSRADDCTILDNVAGLAGGGVFAEATDFFRCRFIGNGQVDDSPLNSLGGGGAVLGQETLVSDCLFSGNLAEGDDGGGAILVRLDGLSLGDELAPVIVGTTISLNGGAGVGGVAGDSSFVDNSILWGNEGDQVGPDVSITFSIVEGGASGEGVIADDPLFTDPLGPDGIVGTIDDDPRLGAGSPAIDAGFNGFIPGGAEEDLVGAPRIQDGDGDGTATVDMGAFERPEGTTCLADIVVDGDVNAQDLLVLLKQWGPCAGCEADFDGDGEVATEDLLVLLGAWGPCP